MRKSFARPFHVGRRSTLAPHFLLMKISSARGDLVTCGASAGVDFVDVMTTCVTKPKPDSLLSKDDDDYGTKVIMIMMMVVMMIMMMMQC